MPVLSHSLYGNSLAAWLIFFLLTISLYFLINAVFKFILRRLEYFSYKTETDVDDYFVGLLKSVSRLFILVVAIYFTSLSLSLSEEVVSFIDRFALIALLLQLGIWGSKVASILAIKLVRARNIGPTSSSVISLLTLVGRVIVWSIVFLLVLENLGVDVTALVAGLGVGGIAVALAVQNVLSDLLSSLSIILDKPFEVGDFIIVDDLMGTVDQIGVKTTRVRALSGEQLVFSNSDLLSSRIKNYKRMDERRIVFSIGVTYQTPHEKLQRVPAIIKSAIDSQKNVRFERAHFKIFGDSALIYEIVYYVLNPEYLTYIDSQQDINLILFKEFEKEGIEFAYPTQTLHVEGLALNKDCA